MSKAKRSVTDDDILSAFAVESEPGREVLERYLALYPEMAGKIIDLDFQLRRAVSATDRALAREDYEMIDTAWRAHLETVGGES